MRKQMQSIFKLPTQRIAILIAAGALALPTVAHAGDDKMVGFTEFSSALYNCAVSTNTRTEKLTKEEKKAGEQAQLISTRCNELLTEVQALYGVNKDGYAERRADPAELAALREKAKALKKDLSVDGGFLGIKKLANLATFGKVYSSAAQKDKAFKEAQKALGSFVDFSDPNDVVALTQKWNGEVVDRDAEKAREEADKSNFVFGDGSSLDQLSGDGSKGLSHFLFGDLLEWCDPLAGSTEGRMKTACNASGDENESFTVACTNLASWTSKYAGASSTKTEREKLATSPLPAAAMSADSIRFLRSMVVGALESGAAKTNDGGEHCAKYRNRVKPFVAKLKPMMDGLYEASMDRESVTSNTDKLVACYDTTDQGKKRSDLAAILESARSQVVDLGATLNECKKADDAAKAQTAIGTVEGKPAYNYVKLIADSCGKLGFTVEDTEKNRAKLELLKSREKFAALSLQERFDRINEIAGPISKSLASAKGAESGVTFSKNAGEFWSKGVDGCKNENSAQALACIKAVMASVDSRAAGKKYFAPYKKWKANASKDPWLKSSLSLGVGLSSLDPAQKDSVAAKLAAYASDKEKANTQLILSSDDKRVQDALNKALGSLNPGTLDKLDAKLRSTNGFASGTFRQQAICREWSASVAKVVGDKRATGSIADLDTKDLAAALQEFGNRESPNLARSSVNSSEEKILE